MILDRIAPNRKPAFGATTLTRFHPLALALVGSWLFTEGGGAPQSPDLLPASSLEGTPPWAVSSPGLVLTFNGSSQSVNAGNSAPLQITDDISVSVLYNSNAFTDQSIVSKDKDVGGRSWTFDLTGSPQRVRFYVNGGGTNLVETTVSNAVWHHAVATFKKATTTSRMYVDGVLQATNSGNDTIPASTANVRIGRREYAGFFNYFSGSIAFVHIWHRTLSDAEVLLLFQSPYAFLTPKAPRLWMLGKPQSGAAAPTMVFNPNSLKIVNAAVKGYW